MPLIDLTPVSATSPQLAAVCAEHECAVAGLIAEQPGDQQTEPPYRRS